MEQQSEYPGIALNDGLPNGKTGGQVILTGSSLRFVWDRGSVELPLQDIVVKRGGASGHLVFFEHHAHPGWIVYTEKKGILKKLKGLSSPYNPYKQELSQQVTHIRKKNLRVRAIILASILIIAAFIYGLYLLRTPVNKAIAKSIPVEWETALGDPSGVWGELLNHGAFLLDQKFSRGFEREADETGFLYLVNARIDPRGMIGFFQRLREESEKAGTLAMEETLNFLSTHPDPGSRIEYLNRKWQQLKEKQGFLNLDADFQVFMLFLPGTCFSSNLNSSFSSVREISETRNKQNKQNT